MTSATTLKHQAQLQEWFVRIQDCQLAAGVKKTVTPTAHYLWKRELDENKRPGRKCTFRPGRCTFMGRGYETRHP